MLQWMLLGLRRKLLRLVISFAIDVGVTEFILEGDSLIISDTLCEQSSLPSSIGPIVYGILSSSHAFRRIEFSHVRRQGNGPTHLLAKHASDIDDFPIWIEESSYFIEQAFLHDVISFSFFDGDNFFF